MKNFISKMIVTIAMIPFMFMALSTYAANPVSEQLHAKILAVKHIDAKGIVLAKGQNNLPRKPHHC